MTHVARGNGCLAGRGDPGDLHIADLEASTQPALLRGDTPCCVRGPFVEGNDSALEILLEGFVEGLLQRSSPLSGREELQAETNLEDCD